MYPILVAIPEEWSLGPYLEQYGFSIITAYSRDEAFAIIHQQTKLNGIVIVSDWAMATQSDDTNGIIKQVQGKIPTVTIITDTTIRGSGYRYMNEVYFPPTHEYVSSPFDLEELVMRMRKVGMGGVVCPR